MSVKVEVIRARIDPKLKREATNLFRKLGLSVSEAFRLFLIQSVQKQSLPFTVEIPNKTTKAAILAARSGEGSRKVSLSQLEKEWNEA